jgi:hypothetical protein
MREKCQESKVIIETQHSSLKDHLSVTFKCHSVSQECSGWQQGFSAQM